MNALSSATIINLSEFNAAPVCDELGLQPSQEIERIAIDHVYDQIVSKQNSTTSPHERRLSATAETISFVQNRYAVLKYYEPSFFPPKYSTHKAGLVLATLCGQYLPPMKDQDISIIPFVLNRDIAIAHHLLGLAREIKLPKRQKQDLHATFSREAGLLAYVDLFEKLILLKEDLDDDHFVTKSVRLQNAISNDFPVIRRLPYKDTLIGLDIRNNVTLLETYLEEKTQPTAQDDRVVPFRPAPPT